MQSLCNELSEYNIPHTLEHGDFHDNNVLLQNGNLTLNDWGDASISHPFFSCVSALKSAQKHHPWMRTTDLQKAYLDSWKSFGNEDRLLKALKLAEKIRFFLFALRFSAVPFCKGGNQPAYRGYMAASLRDFIKN
ncbi:MAG: hypothetical protein B7Y25_06730 [Alphaproteobacteria bacterium 16-39-46]|nr:MAG: hypothetical protein B7Y25_06730 [Alphaproteobacteria bacterium 16-39-46]OZA42195.1 MAG: hypothetical protein B7X84_06805 [Alphaproteobacteria bacterium 17-39-52]HQS84928.1 phosphotransferase [Alphaproteobacteria bacterium]HQS94377.1 phosphotransferase [Alphaproteobacteria bacterium]